MTFYICAFALFISPSIHAHEAHHHGEKGKPESHVPAPPNIKAVYKEIAKEYEKDVKPIFDLKCAACHSLASSAPWYAKMPGKRCLIRIS